MNNIGTQKKLEIKETVVYTSMEYDKFVFIETNRTIDLKHLTKLKKSIQAHAYLNPIIVNEEMVIIDGQHRFEALKSMNRPINYIIDNDIDDVNAAIACINSTTKIWNTWDYVHKYAKMGYDAYLHLQELQKLYPKWKLPVLLNLYGKRGKFKELRNGSLTPTNFNKVLENASLLNDFWEMKIIKIPVKSIHFMNACITAIRTINYDHSHMVRQITNHPGEMYIPASDKKGVEMLAGVYNYRISKARHLDIKLT